MKKINYLILLVVVLVGISCEPTYKKTYSWAYPVAGDWRVNSYIGGVLQKGGPYEIKSYNSSFGKDSVWFDDYGSSTFDAIKNKWTISNGNFYTMKYKTSVNMSTKTFGNDTTKAVMNAIGGYEIGIKVFNGKIIGNDSISFDIQFEDDTTPYGTTYQLAGHREVSYEDYINKP